MTAFRAAWIGSWFMLTFSAFKEATLSSITAWVIVSIVYVGLPIAAFRHKQDSTRQEGALSEEDMERISNAFKPRAR